MTDLDREQLKRDCADALEALSRDQRTDRIAELAESLRTLGPPYRFHGELMHGALRDGQDNAITWHLIHVLEKLEKGERVDRAEPLGGGHAAIGRDLCGGPRTWCRSAATTPGSRYHLTAPRRFGGNTVRWLTLCNPNPDVGPVTCNAILTGTRTDEEAWLFEARLRVVSNVGISYGRSPQDFIVAGPREHCERVRAAFRSKPHAFYAEETLPTEPCKGPLYFKSSEGQ